MRIVSRWQLTIFVFCAFHVYFSGPLTDLIDGSLSHIFFDRKRETKHPGFFSLNAGGLLSFQKRTILVRQGRSKFSRCVHSIIRYHFLSVSVYGQGRRGTHFTAPKTTLRTRGNLRNVRMAFSTERASPRWPHHVEYQGDTPRDAAVNRLDV